MILVESAAQDEKAVFTGESRYNWQTVPSDLTDMTKRSHETANLKLEKHRDSAPHDPAAISARANWLFAARLDDHARAESAERAGLDLYVSCHRLAEADFQNERKDGYPSVLRTLPGPASKRAMGVAYAALTKGMIKPFAAYKGKHNAH